jgi:hypothetical protein
VSHELPAPYRCHVPLCAYSSRCYVSLDNHYKRVHEQCDVCTYCCHVCEAVFSRGTGLTVHLKKQHNFCWPSGHSRFRYKKSDDGYFRLQTIRYEKLHEDVQYDEPGGLESDAGLQDTDSGVQDTIVIEQIQESVEGGREEFAGLQQLAPGTATHTINIADIMA